MLCLFIVVILLCLGLGVVLMANPGGADGSL